MPLATQWALKPSIFVICMGIARHISFSEVIFYFQ
jgi:hypothetical protein